MIHLYCLAVQAGFYSDVVEYWPVMLTARVQSPVAALVIRIFHLLHKQCGLIEEQSDLGPHCLPGCKNRFEKFARIFSRRHKQTFSDAGFLGILRVNFRYDIMSQCSTKPSIRCV